MIQIFKKPAVSFGLRLLLGFIFIYSGVTKLGDLPGFAEAIENYRILPRPMINAFAIVLPWVEVVGGVCLISGILLQGGALLATGLMAIFTLAVAISIASGVDITCGCSTPLGLATRIGFRKLVENVVLFGDGLVIFLYGRPWLSIRK